MLITEPTASSILDSPQEPTRAPKLDERWVLGCVAGALLLLLLGMSGAKWWTFDRVAAQLPEIARLESLESHLRDIDRSTLAIQAARRGFVITGDETQARQAQRIAAELPEQFQRLRKALIAAELKEASVAEVDRIESMVNLHMGAMLTSLAEHRAYPLDAARQQQYTMSGEIALEAVHSSLQALEETVEGQFRLNMARAASGMRRAQWLELGLLLGALAATTGALWLARREMVHREAALSEVTRQRADLGAEVRRRTADLSASLRRYRKLVELSDDAILLCGEDRRVRYANPAAERLLADLGQEAPLGRHLPGLLAPAQRDRLLGALDAVWNGGERLGFTASALRASPGGDCPVEVAAAVYEDGVETQVLLVVHDLRAQRAQEAELRDQLAFIEQLVEAVPLPLSLRDTHGRLRLINRAFEKFHGVDRSEVIGRSAREVLPPGSAEVLTLHNERLQRAGAADFEVAVASVGAEPRMVHVRQRAIRQRDASWAGVLSLETDVTALRQHERSLREHGERLSDLAAQLMAAQEAERRRVARELHDQVGQILTALRMQLVAAAQAVPDSPQLLRGPIDLAEEALAHTRDLTASLHPHVLDDLGLKAALSWLLKRYILPVLPDVYFECRLDPERGDPTLELVAFRVVQEALTNTLRHAEASGAEVRLLSRDAWLHITIRDDGQGFAPQDTGFDGTRHRSVGMSSMRERVEDLGGEFAVDSAPGKGTQLRVLLPWPLMTSSCRGAAHAGIAG